MKQLFSILLVVAVVVVVAIAHAQQPPRRLEGLKKVVSSLLPTEVLSAES